MKKKPAIKKMLSAPAQSHPYKVGSNYFVRGVTMYYTGKLVAVTEHELVLTDAAWIADTGRFADAFKSLAFNEVEPFPSGEIVIGRGSIADACVWPGELPKAQK